MKTEISKIRTVLEEHLAAINENTGEIQALFDYLQELEIKTEKLTQRLDQMQLQFGQSIPKPSISPLNQTERKVFVVLYTEEAPLSYKEIATRASLPEALIPECVSALISKGIPFQRSFFNNQLFLNLKKEFKEMQAKENLINLSLHSFMK